MIYKTLKRQRIPASLKVAILAYKQAFPETPCSEIAAIFEKKIGRKVAPTTIHKILKGKNKNASIIAERAKLEGEKLIQKQITKDVARMLASVTRNRVEAIALATGNIRSQVEGDLAPLENLKIAVELTKIDQLLKGQPTEIVEALHGIDDNTLMLIKQIASKNAQRRTIEGEFDEVGTQTGGGSSQSGGDRDEEEEGSRKDKVFDTN